MSPLPEHEQTMNYSVSFQQQQSILVKEEPWEKDEVLQSLLRKKNRIVRQIGEIQI